MQESKIQWTEATWNPVTGCNKVSPGCKNCYAESIANRFWGERKFTDVICHEDRLNQPIRWRKPKMIFVNSMSDLFHEKVPFEFIDEVLSVVPVTERHTYQILTKRPQRMLEYLFWTNYATGLENFKNIWFGVSVENQEQSKIRIPLLLDAPVAIRFLSVEPMLEAIDIEYWLYSKINWVIIGCESGRNKRECKIGWVEDIVNQCKSYNVPVFVKQININGKVIADINEFPEHLRIREMPKTETELF